MEEKNVYRAIGCMSGTSADGIDLALIQTDGENFIQPLKFKSYPYSQDEQKILKDAFGQQTPSKEVTELVTQKHLEALQDFGQVAEIIGFHGQTILHDPDHKKTIQAGDPQRIADELQTPVVADLRQHDIKNGGQGAPLLPLYHFARYASTQRPVGILNIGGVANLTIIGQSVSDILALDTGPGNSLMNDYCQKYLNIEYDPQGENAALGFIQGDVLDKYLAHPYFDKTPPKSLDRDMWGLSFLEGLATKDALATLAAFTAISVNLAVMELGYPLKHIYVTGGGRQNIHLMDSLKKILAIDVSPVEALGWDGDALEAEGFAYFAVRSLYRLPITFPATTGVRKPLSGGKIYEPR